MQVRTSHGKSGMALDVGPYIVACSTGVVCKGGGCFSELSESFLVVCIYFGVFKIHVDDVVILVSTFSWVLG